MASGKADIAHNLAGSFISWSRRNRSVIRFCLLFALYAACLLGLVGLVEASTGVLDAFSEFLAVATAGILTSFGIAARSIGTLVMHKNDFAIEITYRCTGILQVAFFASAVLALPYNLRTKRVSLIMGTLVILAANLIRILTVYVVGAVALSWVHLAHDMLGELFMIALTVLAWRAALRSMEASSH